jgi:hypothetical protein
LDKIPSILLTIFLSLSAFLNYFQDVILLFSFLFFPFPLLASSSLDIFPIFFSKNNPHFSVSITPYLLSPFFQVESSFSFNCIFSLQVLVPCVIPIPWFVVAFLVDSISTKWRVAMATAVSH